MLASFFVWERMCEGGLSEFISFFFFYITPSYFLSWLMINRLSSLYRSAMHLYINHVKTMVTLYKAVFQCFRPDFWPTNWTRGFVPRTEIDFKNSNGWLFQLTIKAFLFVFKLLVTDIPLMLWTQKTSPDPDPGLWGLQRTSNT